MQQREVTSDMQHIHTTCIIFSILRHIYLFNLHRFWSHWSRGEQEFPFPVIPKNGGLWFPFPNCGNGFFHSLPIPEFRECPFFIPFPFPYFGNGFFPFPSCSLFLGMDFFHSLPIPELWEWNFSFPSRSRIEHFNVGKTEVVSIQTFSSFSTFHTT